jgi:hypothetical protein
VSQTTVVDHRFAPGYPAARAQWLADGAGLGRVVRKFGRSALRQLAIPFAAAAYWMARSILAPRRLNYFVAFAIGNWLGALRGLSDYRVPVAPSGRPAAPTIGRAALLLGAVLVIAAIIAVVIGVLGLMAALRSPIVNAPFVPILAVGAVVILVFLQYTETLPEDHPTRQRIDSHRHAILLLVIVTIVLAGLRLLGTLRLLD